MRCSIFLIIFFLFYQFTHEPFPTCMLITMCSTVKPHAVKGELSYQFWESGNVHFWIIYWLKLLTNNEKEEAEHLEITPDGQ